MRTLTENQYRQYLQYQKIGKECHRILPKLLEFEKLINKFYAHLKEQEQHREACLRLVNRENRKLGFWVDSNLNIHDIKPKGSGRGKK